MQNDELIDKLLFKLIDYSLITFTIINFNKITFYLH